MSELFDHEVDVRGFDIDVDLLRIVGDDLVLILDDLITQRVNGLTEERRLVYSDLETVVFGRVVGAGDHDGC